MEASTRAPFGVPLLPIPVIAAAEYQWTRSDALVLATHKCTICHGSGLRLATRAHQIEPCRCVLRSIFRICYSKYLACVEQPKHLSRASMTPPRGTNKPWAWDRKNEEYIADFELTSGRMLADPAEWELFRLHFLLGADWKVCTRRLGIDRGSFFHGIYRIEERLGRTFREMRPYSLFPVTEYFSGERPHEAYSVRTDGRTKPARGIDG